MPTKTSTKTASETKPGSPAPAAAPAAPAPVAAETPATVSPVTTEVSPAEIVAPLGERMPPVTESAPGEEPRNETPAPSNSSGPDIRDAKGTKFDSFRHQANADGSPRKNAKGNFMLKNEYRLGKLRRDGSAAPAPQSSSAMSPSFAEPARPAELPHVRVPDQYDAAAEVYLQAACGPLAMAFGAEIRPDETDHEALKLAIANYLRASGATELSPGWALTITVAAFAAKKASVPTVQERALSLWEKTKALFGKKPKPTA